MTKQTYTYGDSVIEFYPFNADELQEAIQRAEDRYYNGITTEFENGLAASVNLRQGPISIALVKLLEMHDSGYRLRTDRHIGEISGMLDCTLMKPKDQIEKELKLVHKQAEQEFEAQRFERNSLETIRQLNISTERMKREKEKAAQLAEQQELEEQREAALADLRKAYA